MYHSRIAAGTPTVTAIAGFPPEIDALAQGNLAGHGFLRAAWYHGAGEAAGCTLIVRRGAGDMGGAPIAAIPTVGFGPALLRARKVSGSYWPFRAPLLAPDCSAQELAEALRHPAAARSLGPLWRIGPTRLDDPVTLRFVEAARLARWTVLSRPAGTSWVIDLDPAAPKGNTRSSVARKLRAGWRKLEALGTPHWRYVRGAQWNADVLADLARIEADSWIARTTDGSGAKFLTPQKRAQWLAMIADPVLAQSLSATLLMLDERPIGFSFDCDDGPIRYAIAGTHVEDLKHCYIGKHINYRAMDDATANGLRLMDLGSGDTGYKREMGATAGYALADLLFVRNPLAARVLARIWGGAPPLPPQGAAHG
ncbi:MAG: GNAT family N-acetyltransferase [Erythrobacter sp.]|nr:GNAT family N-acetyltransferase [Erythrobacter sp.]